jgi:hypothetical protein
MTTKKTLTLDKSSLTLRNLTRHTMPDPTFCFINKKQKANKDRCRRRED